MHDPELHLYSEGEPRPFFELPKGFSLGLTVLFPNKDLQSDSQSLIGSNSLHDTGAYFLDHENFRDNRKE